MKKTLLASFLVAVTLFSASQFIACKGKTPEQATTDTMTAPPAVPPTAPVDIASDDQLTNNVKDATKDFPGVTATVSNGEITLTGGITREGLPRLMMALNALQPKKVNNNLTVK
ncbi:MAG: hypothetical protein H7257_12530 [Taibaiella sp.]|nr:hypothetical protein [Taibaiella sp.]